MKNADLHVEPGDYQWLIDCEAGQILAQEQASDESALARSRRLRKRFSAERARLIGEQIELRRRARSKFSLAEQMFFERTALEQATDQWVAHYKASRFARRLPIADLCCGIGGDLLALGGRGPTLGVERDPIKALFAGENARRAGADARVVVGDAKEIDLGAFAAWHIDPDRRSEGRRSVNLQWHEPNLDSVEKLRSTNPHAGVKLAPAAQTTDGWRDEAELEWISRAGECRQFMAWFGNLARSPGRRTATIVAPRGSWTHSVCGTPAAPAEVRAIGPWVFEPDSAVIAACLVDCLAVRLGLGRIDANLAYLTGERPVDDRALASFEVLEVLPFDLKRLRHALRHRRMGRLEVKKRGMTLDPEKLRHALRCVGDQSGTLFITRAQGRMTAILTRRAPGKMENRTESY